MEKEKAKHMKNTILKVTEHKHKNTGTRDLIHPNENLLLDVLLKYDDNFRLVCFN